MAIRKPARWKSTDEALKAVQVAFDVELSVMDAVRTAAFLNEVSPSDQIRRLLQLPTAERPKRPRLTVTLGSEDYALLAERYGLDPEDRLAIKEQVTAELITFAEQHPALPRKAALRQKGKS
ncbi:hypothetical protein [Inhella proteolytica]|uniref:Uncharacterized protein n=1 Tax=Inhella proteolytica TaxID=2795029 RepID=A0A931NGQ1_9BURK|nr:hypothetical protein [Inhella proteolytica]MBH9576948.1 hypothetical protein [Inhella proteolytica]